MGKSENEGKLHILEEKLKNQAKKKIKKRMTKIYANFSYEGQTSSKTEFTHRLAVTARQS